MKNHNIYVGNGILDQIQPPKEIKLTVEDLYEFAGEDCWSILDDLLSDRTDLHDRIKKYKETHLNNGESN